MVLSSKQNTVYGPYPMFELFHFIFPSCGCNCCITHGALVFKAQKHHRHAYAYFSLLAS